MMLGGKVAEEFRKVVGETFRRVMAGDRSLIQVIESNAMTDQPMQKAYRASLASEPTSSTLEDICLKRKCDELDIAERIQKLEEGRENTRAKALHNIKTLQDILGGSAIDERTRLQIQDHTKNLVLTRVNTGGVAIANATNETDSINVAIVAAEMGFKSTDAQTQLIGKKMAVKYREKYGESPPKHKQFVRGSFIPVNSYMERDRAMMADVIREVME